MRDDRGISLDDLVDLKKRLTWITDRQRFVIVKRFGLGGERLTNKEVGQLLGVGQERVRQIEAKAIRKMRTKEESDAIYAKRARASMGGLLQRTYPY